MKIQSYDSPANGHRTYELEDDAQILKVVDFLLREDLPDEMSLSWNGRMYVFRSRVERHQFALGLQHAFETLY